MRAAALQYVRKISGTQKPSAQSKDAFERAIEEVFEATEKLLESLEHKGPPRTREGEKEKAKARWQKRELRIKTA